MPSTMIRSPIHRSGASLLLTHPAGSMDLVAFADAEEARSSQGLRLWSTLPYANPVTVVKSCPARRTRSSRIA
ncbi:MAG: hypothetical protein R2873_30545 [Caldilineaceae bacterium]